MLEKIYEPRICGPIPTYSQSLYWYKLAKFYILCCVYLLLIGGTFHLLLLLDRTLDVGLEDIKVAVFRHKSNWHPQAQRYLLHRVFKQDKTVIFTQGGKCCFHWLGLGGSLVLGIQSIRIHLDWPSHRVHSFTTVPLFT